MSFLTPLYLIGLAAVALPIAFHLLRRTPRGRQVFSTLMFLNPSPPRLTRRSRVDNWLLLLLRALAVCLLAAAFARPFFQSIAETKTVPQRRIALLIDTSASLQREGLWSDAVRQATAVIEDLAATDELTLWAFDHSPRLLLASDEWQSLPVTARQEAALQRLAELSPSWAGTDLASALTTTAERLTGDPGPAEIVVVTDLAAGSRLEGLRATSWPERVTVDIRRVAAASPENAGLAVHPGSNATDATAVRVHNAADSTRSQFVLRFDDGTNSESIAVHVPPGRSRVVSAKPSKTIHRVTLSGDDHAFDNVLHLEPPRTAAATVRVVSTDDTAEPSRMRYYVERAFPEEGRRRVAVKNWTDDATSAGSPLVIVMETPDAARLVTLERYVSEGGTVLFAAATVADCEAFARLCGRSDLTAVEATVDEYALLNECDFAHPLMQPFGEVQFANFTGIHVWRHRSVLFGTDERSRVLMSFDNGDPALIETQVGRGRAYLLTFGWHSEDSQFARSTKFAAMLNRLLDLSRPADLPLQYAVGDLIPAAHGVDSSSVTEPGLYGTASSRFALNVPAEESRTEPLARSRLTELGVRLRSGAAEQAITAVDPVQQAEQTEDRQRVWRSLLAAALAVLVIETILARRKVVGSQPQGDIRGQ